MKKKILLISFIIILIIGSFIIGRQVGLNAEDDKTQIVTREETVSNHDIKKTLTASGTIEAKTTEKLELETTKYFKAMCVENDDTVKAGGNILEYTNGTYLTAPYDCYIVELNLPEIEGKVLNSHYVQIESKNMLSVSMKVDETQINNIDIGKEATIEVTAIDKKYTGYITHIGSIASNGKFDITIEFENDGNVMIGMTANVEITI